MYIVLATLLGLIAPYLIRAIWGPTVWDRLLSMNLVTSKIIMVIVLFASINETTLMLDFAIIYALSSFIGTIFLALFLSERDMVHTKKEDRSD